MSPPKHETARTRSRALEERLRQPDESVWTEASASLGLLACRSAAARERLLALADSPSRFWRMRSLPGLGQVASVHPDGLSALSRLLEDPDDRVREGAARALGTASASSEQAWDMLLRCAGCQDPAARAGAAAALAVCGQSRGAALARLEALTADPDGLVRMCAAAAVAEAAKVSARGALSLLRRLCTQGETDEHVCQGLAQGLAVLLRARAASALRLVNSLAGSHSEAARWCASAALSGLPEGGRSGRNVTERLSRDTSGLVRTRLAQSLAESAPPWAQPILDRLSRDPDRFAAAAAVEALGSFTCKAEVLDALLGLADSRQEHLRAAAAHALGRAAHASEALKALESLAHDPRSLVREAVAAALASPDPQGRTRGLLRTLADDAEPRVRAAVARGLCEPEDEETVLSLAQDKSPSVRLASTVSLRRLAHGEPAFRALCNLVCDNQCREAAAAALADVLDEDPERVAGVLRTVLASLDAEPALSSVASACSRSDLRRVLAACSIMLDASDMVSAARLARGDFAACELAACRELASFARLVEQACSARDLADLAQMHRAVRALAGSGLLAPASESMWASLISAARSAGLAERSRGGADELASLGAAAAALDEAYAEAAAQAPFRRQVISSICSAWQQAIRSAQSDAAQRADIRVILLSGSMIRRPVMKATLVVENAGEAGARGVTINLTAGQGITPSSTEIELGGIHPGAFAEVCVSLRCSAAVAAGQVRGWAHWLDSRKRRRSFSLPVTLHRARRRFSPVPNPYMPGKPLDAASPMFFGRQDVFDLLRDSLRGAHQCNVVGLIGLRRTGKTSIAKRLQSVLGDSYLPIFVDVQGLLVDSLPLLYYHVAETAAAALRSQGIMMDAPDREEADDPGFLKRYVQEAAKRARGRRLLVILDEYDDLEPKVKSGLLPEALFSYLRHLMQHAPNIAFLLCGTHRVEELDPRYWSTLFNLAIYHRLGPLDDASARDLITKPLDEAKVLIEDMAVEKMLRLCGGQPYLLQIAGHCLVSHMNETRHTAIAEDDVDRFAIRLVSSAAGHLQYLWQLASEDERPVLQGLARRWPHDLWLTLGEIREAALQESAAAESAPLDASLRRLIEKDLIRAVGRATRRYGLRVGLMALWAGSGDVHCQRDGA